MEDIELLLDRFSDFRNSGQNKYFDSDDIISLVDYFTEADDMENLQIAIDLGYELHPDNMEFKIQICRTFVNLGDYETALKLIGEIDIEGDREIDMMYIECLCELGMKDDAMKCLDELAEEGCPYFEEIIVHTASVLNDIDEYIHFAYKFITERLEIYPDNEILKTELCFNLELQGRIREAMDKCEKLLQANPCSAELWFMKGRLHTTCCDYGKAIEALDYAQSSLNAENGELKYEILMLKANCFLKNENYYSAIDVYEEVMTMDDIENLEVISHYAECLIMVEDFEQAYHIMKDNLTLEDFKNSIGMTGSFIFCCIMTERREEAVDALCEAIVSFLPQHSKIFGHLASVNALQSDRNNPEENREDRQELVRSFINSNLHVN